MQIPQGYDRQDVLGFLTWAYVDRQRVASSAKDPSGSTNTSSEGAFSVEGYTGHGLWNIIGAYNQTVSVDQQINRDGNGFQALENWLKNGDTNDGALSIDNRNINTNHRFTTQRDIDARYWHLQPPKTASDQNTNSVVRTTYSTVPVAQETTRVSGYSPLSADKPATTDDEKRLAQLRAELTRVIEKGGVFTRIATSARELVTGTSLTDETAADLNRLRVKVDLNQKAGTVVTEQVIRQTQEQIKAAGAQREGDGKNAKTAVAITSVLLAGPTGAILIAGADAALLAAATDIAINAGYTALEVSTGQYTPEEIRQRFTEDVVDGGLSLTGGKLVPNVVGEIVEAGIARIATGPTGQKVLTALTAEAFETPGKSYAGSQIMGSPLFNTPSGPKTQTPKPDPAKIVAESTGVKPIIVIPPKQPPF